MTSVAEGPIPFKIPESTSSIDGDDQVVAVLFFGLCLVLGIASRHVLRGTKVPYTVALLVLGIALGSLEYGTSHHLGKIGAGIRLWANINPDLLLAVFLPALLFESSFSMEVHQIKRCMAQMFLLAGPGVIISTFFLGSAIKLAFPYDWSWKTSLLLGGLLSATDPVAVVALLKELGASKKLNTIIEGESLMNDGTAIVVFQLFYRMVLGESFTVGDIIKYLTRVSIGAVGIGLAFGIASFLWLGYIFNDTVIEITLTLAVSYIAYFTAQDAADVSGVLTVMTLGMEMVAYIANTLIFILSGVVIAESVLHSKNYFENHGNILLLKRTRDNLSCLGQDTGTLFVFFTGGIVFLTLIVNGSTTQFVLHHLHMDKLTEAKPGVQAAYWGMLEEGRISQNTANIMMQAVDEAMDLVSHKTLCDWNVERLESACYICAAFLRAHRIARRQLHDFLGDSEIASVVINESEAEGEEARKYLEDVRVIFPQVGLLEEKEMIHLHDAVQTDLKKLLRNPPLVKMPKISDMLRGHPLLGALPPQVRQPLEGSTKEQMKLHGVPIYKEGYKPTGIWLISNGVVKFSGPVQVLIGKPYICNMITDSTVHCFFIEAEKIISVLRSDPTVEGFLWQDAKATSFCHQGSGYLVETRARVILFDMAALEGDNILQK
ncbi:hypothetical protein IFM89_020805, partial [Coptis chinensis]